eukprot:TRINITY_DN1804_c0_g3_i2.p1 TRINITY_DN1804_c0_g3~~TRINITY_DN1804_c0_g3_i2.p1  ORF type:complete len:470 (-),score=39.07 TRINITY_DN1804_c0_g3_i2:921-2330(-)
MLHRSGCSAAGILVMFCGMNTIIYIERGALSSTSVNGSARSGSVPDGTGIQGYFDLSLVEDGLLSSAFMVGLLVASPVFAELSKQRNAFRLVGIGLSVWVVSVLACGLSYHYSMILIARMMVGVGEASFVTLAAPFIDDNAPPNLKSLWLGLFYMCTPAGQAIGYIFGGTVGAALGWRAVFFIEAAAMLPLVVIGFIMKPIDLRKEATVERQRSFKGAAVTFFKDVRTLFLHPLYIVSVVVNTLQVGVTGVLAFWGPRASKTVFNLPGDTADKIFGLVTFITGIGGTVLGGLLLDRKGASLTNASLFTSAGLLIAFLFMLPSFLFVYSIYGFVPIFALGEIGLFSVIAPITAISLWSVPVILRPLGQSVMTVFLHVFGDVPSPPIIGAVQTFLARYVSDTQAWRYSMALTIMVLLVASLIMFIGMWIARYARDYRYEKELDDVYGDLLDDQFDEPVLISSMEINGQHSL